MDGKVSEDRAALVARWFALTRDILPPLAATRGWPVDADHCFQRIFLDHAAGGPWRASIAAPAWRNATDAQLGEAVRLAAAALAGTADLPALNRRSIAWRRAARDANAG